jgi:hypothetical protein
MANNKAEHPLYGSIKLGDELSRRMNVSGSDGGTFSFGSLPMVSSSIGLDTYVSRHQYDDGLNLFVQNIGTQTTTGPIATSAGMDYSYGNTNNLGVQWSLAEDQAKEYHTAGPQISRYTVGTDAFFCEMKWSIEDVSGADECAFGFRKVEAYQAAIDDYDEMAAFNIVSGDIKTETIINGASTVTTDLTSGGGDGAGNWANDATHTVKVMVSAAGAVTYSIDGAASPTGAVAFSFDVGEIVTPFFYYLNDSDVAGAVVLQELKHGRQ